jgi:hemerythrin superfamily protein
MDIYNYLKKDHRMVAKMFDQVMKSKSTAECKKLMKEIESELSLHAETEEKTFYTALRGKNAELSDKMQHAKKEHDEIRSYISKIERVKHGSPEWYECLGEFKHSVTHHVDEEEDEIFDMAKKVLSKSEAVALAERMDALKQKKKPKGKGKKASMPSKMSNWAALDEVRPHAA